MATVYCPDCDAFCVNGVATHEHGCPRIKERWTKRRGGYLVPVFAETPKWMERKPGKKEDE